MPMTRAAVDWGPQTARAPLLSPPTNMPDYDILALAQSGVRVLNLTQRVSAMSFATFVTLHLSV